MFFSFSIHCVPSVSLYTSTGINIQFGLFWPLECLLHIEFYSKIRDFFRLLILLLVLWSLLYSFRLCTLQLNSTPKCLFDLSNVSSNWIYSFRDIFQLLILLFVLIDPFFLSFCFSFSSFVFFFVSSFVWTSGLSFCLIILVFARMSLRVNFTARRFLMILHCLLGQRSVEAAGVLNSSVRILHVIHIFDNIKKLFFFIFISWNFFW